MAILTVIKANGTVVSLPNPQEMTWSIQDVDADGSGRNRTGTMFRDRVAVKRKLTCSFPPMNSTKMSTLLNAVTDQFFTLRYPDAQTGAYATMTCYVGDRTAPALRLVDGKWLWDNLSMNFIER